MVMDEEVDPCSGYSPRSGTYHTLRPKSPIPPESLPISLTDFLLSNLPTSSSNPLPFLIDSSTGATLSYSHFLSLSHSLSLSLISRFPSLSKSHLAFLLSPNSPHLPVLYFSLLSLGVVLSPASPLGSPSDILHQLLLSRPSIAFATSSTSHLLPTDIFPLGVVLIDSPDFASMLTPHHHHPPRPLLENVNRVVQSDTATVLYSSGTTGRVKGVVMSHRSMIAALSRFYHPNYTSDDTGKVILLSLPLFHVYGMFMMFRGFAGGKTLVLSTKKFDVVGMLRVVERYKVNVLPASPPVVVAMVKLRGEEREKLELSSLTTVVCGGASLAKDVSRGFQAKFPRVTLLQVKFDSPALPCPLLSLHISCRPEIKLN